MLCGPVMSHFTVFLSEHQLTVNEDDKLCDLYVVVSALLDKGAQYRPLEVLPVLHKRN